MPWFGRFIFGAVNTVLMFLLIVSGVMALGIWTFAICTLGATLDSRVITSAITVHALVTLAITALLWLTGSFEETIRAERRLARLRGRGDE